MEQLPGFPPATLAEVQSRFADWRKTKHHRSRIPEDLWAAAVMLCQEHSLSKISQELGLSYTDLKERVQRFVQTPHLNRISPSQDFIPIDITSAHTAECVVEMDHHNGNRMRMHFKGKVDLDLQSFAEAFWHGKV